jgi:hypothetical protein
MALTFKDIIDVPDFFPLAVGFNAHAAGISLAADLRNDESRHPEIFQLVSNAILNSYNPKTDGWQFVNNPGLATTFGAGAGAVFAPSASIKGLCGAGCSTTKIVTQAITAVLANTLANRGDGVGFKIRIIGNAAGSSGKTEEKWIVSNSASTTPTIYLDSALTFTPANGDAFEILCGTLYCLGAAALAAGSWKAMDMVYRTMANKTQTNLPATVSTDSSFICLDELYVPYDRNPGDGFFGNITATAVTANTIQASAIPGSLSLQANEYRNFQVRIVQDTGTPTAVGQRRQIASHTSGATPTFTVGANWTVNPSATAIFVIENPNLIILFTSGVVTVYTYNYTNLSVNNGTNTIAADAWNNTFFSARGSAMAAGCTSFPSFGIEPDADRNARHSYIYSFRGGAVTLDLLDIAGSITGTWSAAIPYFGQATVPTTGTCGKYAPADRNGRYGYLVLNNTANFYRFDVFSRVLEPWTQLRSPQSGTAAVGDRIATLVAVDGSVKTEVIFFLSHLASNFFKCLVQR